MISWLARSLTVRQNKRPRYIPTAQSGAEVVSLAEESCWTKWRPRPGAALELLGQRANGELCSLALHEAHGTPWAKSHTCPMEDCHGMSFCGLQHHHCGHFSSGPYREFMVCLLCRAHHRIHSPQVKLAVVGIFLHRREGVR